MEREDLKIGRKKKSFRDIYLLAEKYRQGLSVEMDKDKAWDYYRDIVEDANPSRESNDFYWRACYRLGMELYFRAGSLESLREALRLVAKAKDLYERRDQKAKPADITKEELYDNYRKLILETFSYLKTMNELPVLKRVRCIVDDEFCLTKGKIYDVLTEENGLYGVIDDEEEDIYLYGKSCFEDVNP